jgi:hypothetical protein
MLTWPSLKLLEKKPAEATLERARSPTNEGPSMLNRVDRVVFSAKTGMMISEQRWLSVAVVRGCYQRLEVTMTTKPFVATERLEALTTSSRPVAMTEPHVAGASTNKDPLNVPLSRHVMTTPISLYQFDQASKSWFVSAC